MKKPYTVYVPSLGKAWEFDKLNGAKSCLRKLQGQYPDSILVDLRAPLAQKVKP